MVLVLQQAPLPLRVRVAGYVALTKPRIAVMGLVTVALGFLLATTGEWSAVTLGHSLLGIGLIAAQRGGMKLALPFGTFLALGALAAMFAGDPLIAWYAQFF